MASQARVECSSGPPSSPPTGSNFREEPALDSGEILQPVQSKRSRSLFCQTVDWTRSGNKPSPASKGPEHLKELLLFLEEEAPLRAQFQNPFHAMLGEIQAVSLIAEAGLHPRESMWSEAVRRIVERVLPSAREDADLSKLVYRLHTDDRYIQGFLDWSDELFERAVRVLTPDDDLLAWNRQRLDLKESLRLLGTHVAGVGLAPEFRERCHPYAVDQPACRMPCKRSH